MNGRDLIGRCGVVWRDDSALIMGEIAMVWSPDCGRDFFYRKFLDYLILLIYFFDGGFNLRQVQPASRFASQVKGKVAIFDIF
jgi:hypothetical protein